MSRSPRRVGAIGLVLVAILAIAVVVAGCGSSKKSASTSTSAAKVTGGTGQTIDGIPCNRTEQLTYHVHAHLELLNNGASEPLPALIGIPLASSDQAACFYFLHTHDTTGVIHMEAPAQRTFTLGQFFDIWGQPLSRTRATNLTGPLHVFVGQKPYTGNPRNIKLTPHELVTIEQGKVVKPPPYTFGPGL
jgi:hypothetical protein